MSSPSLGSVTIIAMELFQASLLEQINDSTTTLRRNLEMQIVSGLGEQFEFQKGTLNS